MRTLDWPEAKMPKMGKNMPATAIQNNSKLKLKNFGLGRFQQGQIRNKAQHSQSLSLEAKGNKKFVFLYAG